MEEKSTINLVKKMPVGFCGKLLLLSYLFFLPFCKQIKFGYWVVTLRKLITNNYGSIVNLTVIFNFLSATLGMSVVDILCNKAVKKFSVIILSFCYFISKLAGIYLRAVSPAEIDVLEGRKSFAVLSGKLTSLPSCTKRAKDACNIFCGESVANEDL